MKKLLTILASAATMFAVASAPEGGGSVVNHYADFEASGFVSGAQFNAAYNDMYTGATGERYWYTADADASNVISNHLSIGKTVPISSRPDLVKDNDNSNFLQIETSGKLWRSVKNNGGTGDFTTNSTDYGYSIVANPIYLDTLVKFTAADSAFGDDALEGGDKIAISYVEHEAEDDDPYTNFVVRAGFIGDELTAKNYFVTVPEGFNKDDWHRLTVRTIPDVGDGSVGFVIYLDETNLTYSTSVSAGFGTLNSTAESFYNNEKHALFPSAIAVEDIGGQTISAAAFSGNGSLDDVTFTTSTPNFITAGEAVIATINLGTGISGATVKVGVNEIAPVDATANPLVFNLDPGTESFTLVVTADTANGYTFNAGGIVCENASYNEGVVTISGGNPTLTLTGTRNNVTYIDGDGNPQGSPSLATAIAGAKAGTTITLAYSIDVVDAEGSGFTTYTISGKALTIDLNGNTITWNDVDAEDSLFTIASSGSLTVIDSSVANTGTIIYAGVEGCVFYNSGECFVGATSGDYGPTVQGVLTSNNKEPVIVRGKFDKAKNTANSTFKWADSIAEGSALGESLGDYWIVEPTGTPQPTTYALTLPTVTGASAVVTEKDGGVEVDDIAAIAENTEVVVTWTASSGYKITAGATEDITMDSDKTAATPTVVAITYATLTITPVDHCTIVVSNSTAEVASGTTFDVDDAEQLTVYRTPADGYVLDNCLAVENIMMNTDQTVTAAVKVSGGSNWPSTWNNGTEPASMAAAFNTWIAVSGNDPTAENAEAAFLLGVNVADYTGAFAAASITLADGKVVITGNYDLTKINGVLSVKMGNEPNALNTTTVIGELTNGAISLTPALGETKKFYQLVIGYPAN